MRSLCFLCLLAACASAPEGSAPRPKPPPKPGSSITHTQMCACTACPVARCCSGETEEAESRTCKDSYDFSGACGMSVSSCTGRCYQKVWRIGLSEACSGTRPADCCAAG